MFQIPAHLNHRLMLPPEILLHIFGFLKSEPFRLVSCCEAHPLFAKIIEPALYRYVIVHNMPPAENGGATPKNERDGFRLSAPELSNILSNSPHIVRYLHNLAIELSHFHLDSDATRHISSILHKLRPSRIILSGADCFSVDWSYFPAHFALAFVGSISKSHLREVSITSALSFPLSTFRNCKTLKTLKLDNGSTSSIELLPCSPIPPHPLLEHLEITCWSSDQSSVLISWLKPRIINLRSLMLKISNEHFRRALPELLSICSTTLVELEIRFHHGNPAEHFDFSNHKSLKRLKLYKNTSSSRSEDIRDTDLIRASLLTIIPTLETVPSLDLLILSLGLWFNWKNIAGVDWSPLADYLPSASSKFRNIELHISPAVPRNNISFDEIFILLVRYDNLMTLVKDGVLSIKPGEVWFP